MKIKAIDPYEVTGSFKDYLSSQIPNRCASCRHLARLQEDMRTGGCALADIEIADTTRSLCDKYIGVGSFSDAGDIKRTL